MSTPRQAADDGLRVSPDYMAKEIAEQAGAVATIVDRLAGGIPDGSLWCGLGLPMLSRVRFVACGTSLNAAAVLSRLLARAGGVPATLGVAATKTFTAQVVAGSAVLLSGLVASGRLDPGAAAVLAEQLVRVPEQLASAQRRSVAAVPAVAGELADAAGFLFLGRGAGVPYAAEGALKLKEISYRWAEYQRAGELKHGPIALIERGTPLNATNAIHHMAYLCVPSLT